jgi:hypothetical protein
MRISPLRTAQPGTGLARRAVAGGLLLALAAGAAAMAAGPAVAAPLSVRSAAQQAQQTQQATGVAGSPVKVTWGIMPATSSGPDKNRVLFNYGTVKPGSTVLDHVEVVNYSAQSAAFSIYGTDATGTTTSGALLLLSPQQKPTDIGAWVRFPGGAPQLSTIIPGGRAIVVAFSIKVPLQATPGDHTGGLAAAVSVTNRNSKGTSVVENYRIATPLEMRVPGALHAALQVQSISTGFSDPINPFGTGSATISYSVANTGNVRLTGTHSVTVTGPFGQQVTAQMPALPDVLPGDSVRYTAVLPNLFPVGPMTAKISVTPGWPPRSQPLPTTASPTTSSASLFAMPWSLLGLFVLLIGLGVGVWLLLRMRRREHRAEVMAAAARARKDTERRLLGDKPTAGTTAPSSSPSSSSTEPDTGSTPE